MAVMLYMKMPGASLETIEAVTEEMNVRNDPPPGLIIHGVVEIGGTITVVDMWESRADFDKFNETRLGPAFEKVATGQGIDLSAAPQPSQEWVDVLDIVKGA